MIREENCHKARKAWIAALHSRQQAADALMLSSETDRGELWRAYQTEHRRLYRAVEMLSAMERAQESPQEVRV